MSTTPVQPQRVEFVKAISRLDATALVVGSMIGSGIFIVSAEILKQVHSPGLLLVGLAGVGGGDAAGRADVRRAGGDVPQGGRQLRLPARRHFAAVRLSLRLDVVRRDSDRDDRRGRRGVRAFHLGALARAVARRLSRHDAPFPQPIGDIASASRRSGSSRSRRSHCSPGSTCAACAPRRSFRRRSPPSRPRRSRCSSCWDSTIGRNAAAIAANFGSNFWAGGG
jgi:hypothetical protein